MSRATHGSNGTVELSVALPAVRHPIACVNQHEVRHGRCRHGPHLAAPARRFVRHSADYALVLNQHKVVGNAPIRAGKRDWIAIGTTGAFRDIAPIG